jgi:hypothetical protein
VICGEAVPGIVVEEEILSAVQLLLLFRRLDVAAYCLSCRSSSARNL